MQLEP